MSGRTKRILYRIADLALFVVLAAGMLFVPIVVAVYGGAECGWREIVAYSAAVLFLVLGVPALVHECGHLLFGALAGMRLASFRFRPFDRKGYAGATAMYPKNGRHTKAKLAVFTLGGALVNLLLGGAALALWLCLPYHPALLFSGAISGSLVYEGVCALLPAELPAGKTDGAVLLGLAKGAAEEEIAVRVLTAQGILYRGSFADIPPETLFCAPVVREDLPAYHALLLLGMQARLAAGETGEAERLCDRLSSLAGYLTDREIAELGRYESFFRGGTFECAPSPFAGVRALEEALGREKTQKKNKTPVA